MKEEASSTSEVWPTALDTEDLYHRAPCGYLTTSPDGLIVRANDTLARWLGWSVAELGTRTFADLLTLGGQIFHETHIAPMLRMHGEAREIAVDLLCRDGTRLPVLVNATMDRAPGGAAGMVRIAVFDATERRRYERELVRAKERAEASEERARTLARTLQQTLIPPALPPIAGLDVAAAYRPAGDGSEVGGDFYDVFDLGDDDWIVVLGDVCGKGAEAAVITALVRYTIRALAVGTRRPAQLLERLNDAMLHHGSDRFCTVVLVRLRRQARGWQYQMSVGGHPAPLMSRADDRVQRLEVPGPLLGVIEGATYVQHEGSLEPGDCLVLYTDGVTEAWGGAGFFGDERLLSTVDSGPAGDAADVVDKVLAEVLRFQDGVPRDDIALLALAAR